MKLKIVFLSALVLFLISFLNTSAQPSTKEMKLFNKLCSDLEYDLAIDTGKVFFNHIYPVFKGKTEEPFHQFLWKMFERQKRKEEGLIFFHTKFEEYLQSKTLVANAYFWIDLNLKIKNFPESKRAID